MSPTCLCSSARVAEPSTISLSASRPCPDRTGGATRACGLATMLGTNCPSTWNGDEVGAGPGGHVGVVVECLERLGRDVVGRVEHVVPVPPVQRRVRDQGAQAAGEGEGGHARPPPPVRCPPAPSGRGPRCGPVPVRGRNAPRPRRPRASPPTAPAGPGWRCGPSPAPGCGRRGGAPAGRRARRRRRRAPRRARPAPAPSTVQSKAMPPSG